MPVVVSHFVGSLMNRVASALFKRYRKYGVAVFMCEHHGVKEYIEIVVKSCREWLNKVK
jgi:hypothetical protein